MPEDKEKKPRLFEVAKELNLGTKTLIEYLQESGFEVKDQNQKISQEMHNTLLKKFASEKQLKEKAIQVKELHKETKEKIKKENIENQIVQTSLFSDEVKTDETKTLKIVGKIDLEKVNSKKSSKIEYFESTQTSETAQTNVNSVVESAVVTEKEPLIKEEPIIEQVEAAKEEKIEKLNFSKTKKKKKDEEPVIETTNVVENVVVEQPTEVIQNTVSNDIEVAENEVIRAKDNTPKLTGPKVLGKIELPTDREKLEKERKLKEKLAQKNAKANNPPTNNSNNSQNNSTLSEAEKKKRKRKRKQGDKVNPINNSNTNSNSNTGNNNQGNNNNRNNNQGGNNNNFNRTNNNQGGNNNNNRTNNNQGGNNNNNNRTNNNQGGNNNNNNNRNNNQGGNNNNNNNRNNNQGFQLSGFNKRSRQKIRKNKRDKAAGKREALELEKLEQSNVLEVTEFLTANDLASLMNVSVNEVIGKCMRLGMFVSINQRIEADVIQLIAEEFGFEVKFISMEEEDDFIEEEEDDELLVSRPPIVTVMGHVDHGKTSLLDHIRKSNVIAGEAGGITQHIGAYEVQLESGKKITFLDTPGHEAFTAMRARGAQVTDIAIIVIAADDQVMPQTREAINHAQAAGVPMVFAINKVDKPGADVTKIFEQLAQMNLLVEEWGGKFQSQQISAKFGQGINELLDKVLLESEFLDLRANPDRNAKGTVIEAKLDKGRGITATILVQTGTLSIGDIILVNSHYGRVKAMFDERGKPIKKAGPSTPVQILGLGGVPQAGDKFNIMETEREAREIATRRQQLLREQTIRTQKHITLDEIARRRAVGNFKELNIIVKGDVDGSIEALADSLLKLSTQEVQVNILMKGVGQISESDVMLASASDAIVIGFQVRPSSLARRLAETEQIDIRLYSIIYDAINEVKDALEGMLAPTIEERIIGTVEVRETFKITKVGTVAGCVVTEGKVQKVNQIRLIREGIVVHTGKIDALKRFKNDAKEVDFPNDCGISIHNYQDIRVGDIIECFEVTEIKRKL